MEEKREQDWDPRSEAVMRDQRAAYDAMRERCPVAFSDYLQWSVFRHEDVMRVLNDHAAFSSATSRHLSVPNGMDPPEHTAYRRVIEPYFTPARMQAFEPVCRSIAADLVQRLLGREAVEVIADLGQAFAVRIQCAFLGWPADLHEPLRVWTRKNQEATLTQDREAMNAVARELTGYVEQLLGARRERAERAPDDITTSLLHLQVNGKPLRDGEIVSILRNWTVGEVGTIAASVGILAHFLAQEPDHQRELRAQPSLLAAAIDEILRLHGPLVANRRITTRPVEIGGRKLEAGERLSLIWVSANRDGRAFDAPDTFRLDRDPAQNLLYGAGIHVCPGAPLASLELRVLMEELLRRTQRIEPVAGKPPTLAVYPASGFSELPLRIT
ncbi:MAG: cytochrome P450 [Betaproteobacteria bacterium]|nr:cytochrome P450 [Betaproteobacteria bacterium]